MPVINTGAHRYVQQGKFKIYREEGFLLFAIKQG